MKFLKSFMVCLFAVVLTVSASAGVLVGAAKGSKELAKGAFSDLKAAGKVASFPVRHPKKSAQGVAKGAKASAKSISKL